MVFFDFFRFFGGVDAKFLCIIIAPLKPAIWLFNSSCLAFGI